MSPSLWRRISSKICCKSTLARSWVCSNCRRVVMIYMQSLSKVFNVQLHVHVYTYTYTHVVGCMNMYTHNIYIHTYYRNSILSWLHLLSNYSKTHSVEYNSCMTMCNICQSVSGRQSASTWLYVRVQCICTIYVCITTNLGQDDIHETECSRSSNSSTAVNNSRSNFRTEGTTAANSIEIL